MKIKILVLFLLSLLLTPLLTIKAEDTKPEKWFAFVIGQKLNPKSHANIGKYVLDAPAGKHGFTQVKDGHFYFKDGARAKFWGTNLCYSACFPSKEQAILIARRLAFFGFNAVRLHHMDSYFEPEGIFQDTCPAYSQARMKKTQELSPRQLDKLDYLIYQLKLQGIYVDMNLLVSRHFTEADGVTDADKLGMAAKPVSMFSRELIQLQKKYARDLLSHYNKYTKLEYRDDPSIALIEITNENSIINAWYKDQLNGPLFGLKKSSIPENYSSQLNLLWNEWLKNKYQTEQNVKNAWFSLQQNNNPKEIPVENANPYPERLNTDNKVIEQPKDAICVKKPSSAIENIPLKQITGNEIINIQDISGFNFPRPLQSLKAFYSPQAILDIKEFYIELEKKYFTEMTAFLKDTLNIKIPITGIGGYYKDEDILAQEPCDYIDAHSYWDHPVFPGEPWDRNNFTIHNKSTLAEKDNGIINNLIKKIEKIKELGAEGKQLPEYSTGICLLKPVTISEWNHCYPNQYAYETPLFLAAESIKNNWDGLFQFAFKHKLPPKPSFSRINSYFDIMNNPQQLILNSLASFIFLGNNPVTTNIDNGMLTIDSTSMKAIIGFIKNRPLSFNGLAITADQDGVIAILKESNSLLITAISKVKDTQSEWINPAKFHWGKEPVLLKKITLEVKNTSGKEITVYELDNQGRHKKKINTLKQKTQISFSTAESESPWFEITYQ